MRGEPENTNLKVEANSNDINVFSEVREAGGGGGGGGGGLCIFKQPELP